MKELYNLLIFGVLGTIFFFGPIFVFFKLNQYLEKKGMHSSRAGTTSVAITLLIFTVIGGIAMSLDG